MRWRFVVLLVGMVTVGVALTAVHFTDRATATQGAGLPELTGQIAGPGLAAPGAEIGPYLSASVSNTGFGPVDEAFVVDAVLSQDGTVPPGLAPASSSFKEDALLPNGRATVNPPILVGAQRAVPLGAVIPADTPPGQYNLCIRVDAGDAIPEDSEFFAAAITQTDNNLACTPMQIAPPAAIGVQAQPQSALVGGQSLVIATVSTATGAPLAGVLVSFAIDNPTVATFVGSGFATAARSDATGRAVATVSSAGQPGTANVTATTGGVSGLTSVTFTQPGPPDLTLSKAALHGDSVTQGAPLEWSISVGNAGVSATTSPIVVVDSLPAGAVGGTGSGTGWTCTSSASAVTCTLTQPIAVGATGPALTITARAPADSCAPLVNTATVSGGGDGGADPDATSTVTTAVLGCGALDVTLNPEDAMPDATGQPTLTATSADGDITVEVRGFPSDAGPIRVQGDLLTPTATDDVVAELGPEDQELLASSAGILLGLEVNVTDDAGNKTPGTVTVVFPPPDVELYLLAVFVVGPDGQLVPVPTTIREDGRVAATIPFDFTIIVPALPADTITLRTGFTGLAHTGHEVTIEEAYPGTAERGDGLFGIFRFESALPGYQIYRPSRPELGTALLRQFDPMFMQVVEGTATLKQGRLLRIPHRPVEILAGPNMVIYTGSDGSVSERVDSAVLSRATALWKWSNALQRWLGHFPGLREELQGFTRLQLGDVVFVSLPERVFWNMR